MQIYANKNIRIIESLSTSLRSSIIIVGSVAYGQMAWGERIDFKRLLDEEVRWGSAIATISFTCLEEDKDEKHNELGWICMDGNLNLNKTSKSLSLQCNCCLMKSKWLQLKNDFFETNDNNYCIEFKFNQINTGLLVDTDDAIESKTEMYMESYSIVKYFPIN
jgi:hypothetical protein